MQVLSPLKITTTQEDLILQALLDEHCRAILGATKENAVAASKLALDCNIPLSTVYRKLKILRDLKFLHISCTIQPNGKKLLSFQNRLAGIDISWVDAKLQIHTNFSSH